MDNLIAFGSSFCSYLFTYFVFIAAIIIAFLIGVKTSKKEETKVKVSETADSLTVNDDAIDNK